MMKKIGLVVALLIAIVVGALCIPEREAEYDYLRLHIRANSNSSIDQNVKYQIKDSLVEYLTPYLCNVESKDRAVEYINHLSREIEQRCERILIKNGFNYKAHVKIANEYFPTRTYSNTTLQSGYYDAVIVELGEATGDNWWCVMYPPLCFVNKNEIDTQIKYKSKIAEWFNSIFR